MVEMVKMQTDKLIDIPKASDQVETSSEA